MGELLPCVMRTGEYAPEFSLPDQHGAAVHLSDVLGKGPVVVFFYPKAGSPGCTREACAFRDVYSKLLEAGVNVVGVSGDHVEEIAAFAREHRLFYPLLSDARGRVRRLWKVPRDFLLLPGRVTYVLERGGKVTKVIRSAVRMEKHVAEALREVVRLRRESGQSGGQMEPRKGEEG